MAKAVPVRVVNAPDGKELQYPSKPQPNNGSKEGKNGDAQAGDHPITCSEVYTVFLLLVINLANFADRLTVPSVLTSIKTAYNIEDQMILGLLQTVFVITYMIFSPIFGYLGDRFNRRILMAIGLVVWGGVSLASAFVSPDWPNAFWIFMVLRGMIGTGEASYVTISPTIISDLFVGRRRTIVLVIYQSAMLLGSGIGYMMASAVSGATGNWHHAFMVWPPVVFLCAIGLIFMKEPERGRAEGTTNLAATSYWEDLKYLIKVKSYVYTTLGYTSTVFVVGAISFWAPTFAEYTVKLEDPDASVSFVGLVFGVITIIGGLVGAVGGTLFSKLMRRSKCIGDKADAIACAIGAIGAGPLIYLNVTVAWYNTIAMWAMIFFSLTFLSINLVLTQEITLYVLIPTRRATGTGVQLLVSHLFGDAASPYIIGAIVDGFRYAAVPPHNPNNYELFVHLQHALFFTTLICVIGSFCFFFCSLYVVEDKHEATALAASLSAKSLTAVVEDFQMYPPGYRPGLSAPNAALTSPVSSGYMSSSQLQIVAPSSPDIDNNNNNNDGQAAAHNIYYTNSSANPVIDTSSSSSSNDDFDTPNNKGYTTESTAL